MAWFRAGIEIVACVEDGILIELICATVQGVRSRLHDLINHRAAVVAVLRGKAVVLDLYFLQGLDRSLVIDI